MEFKVKQPEKVKVVFSEDEFYEVAKPTLGQSMQLQELVLEAQKDETKSIQVMVDWIDSMGLPKEASMKMPPDQFLSLCEVLAGLKKN